MSTETNNIEIKQLVNVNNEPIYPVVVTDSVFYTETKIDSETNKEYEVSSTLTDVIKELKEKSIDSLEASKVSYTHNNNNNVEEALDNLYDMINWKVLTIDNFKMSPSTTSYEVGTNISSLTFTWDTSRKPNTLTFNNSALTVENDNSYSHPLTNVVKSAPGSNSYKVTATYLDKDGKTNLTAESTSKSISWNYYVFYGSCLTSNLNSITLSRDNTNKYLYATSKSGITMNVPVNSSLWVAVQSDYKVNNIVDTANMNTSYQLEVVKDANGNAKNFSYTLPNNVTVNYNIYYRHTDNVWDPTMTISLAKK